MKGRRILSALLAFMMLATTLCGAFAENAKLAAEAQPQKVSQPVGEPAAEPEAVPQEGTASDAAPIEGTQSLEAEDPAAEPVEPPVEATTEEPAE